MVSRWALPTATLVCGAGRRQAGWNLNPAAAMQSEAYGVSGGQQVGYAQFSEFNGQGGDYVHAGMWSGSAASWVDLNPAGASASCAFGISDGQEVGCAELSGPGHAGVWSGTAASWVDLNPAGTFESAALGVSDGRQVGWVMPIGYNDPHAGIWSGTAASWLDLQALLPAGVYLQLRGHRRLHVG